MKKIFLLTTAFIGLTFNIFAQCVQCDNPQATLGTNASRLGTGTVASGHSAFASGYNSSATANYSTALGYNAFSSGLYSAAIGKNIAASSTNSFVIGTGYSSSAKLTNNVSNSIMLGIGSSTPTITIRHKTPGNVPAYVGIGTDDPKQMLHIVDGNILISRMSSNGNRAPGSTNGSILFGDVTTTQYPYGAWGIEYVNNTDYGYGLNFWKTADSNGSTINHVLFLCEESAYKGNVGIGTAKPKHKLSVNGTIQSKEVIVTTLATDWPDHVFEAEYKLTSLEELESYVKREKHLPGVPSANEIDEEGIKVGEMNALLLQKVEELTLYVIELEKQIKELKGGND